VRFVGGGSSSSVFHKILFYYMPNTCDILYEQNLDMSEHRRTLGFERDASFINDSALHLTPRTVEIDNEECIDFYDFVTHDMAYIEKWNASIVHSIPLVDDAFGGCAKLWCIKGTENEGLLQIISMLQKKRCFIP